MGLVIFLTCCAGVHDPDHPGRYLLEKDRVLSFVKKNMANLSDFVEEHDLSDEVGKKATDEICCTLLEDVMGSPVGVVNRISTSPGHMKMLEMLHEQVPMKLYFMMDSPENKVAFLFVSEDQDVWEHEKEMLEDKKAFAVVADLDKITAKIRQIRFEMLNGGPIFTAET